MKFIYALSYVIAHVPQTKNRTKMKSLLYSRYYAEKRNEWRGPFLMHSTWETQLQRSVSNTVFDFTYSTRKLNP